MLQVIPQTAGQVDLTIIIMGSVVEMSCVML